MPLASNLKQQHPLFMLYFKPYSIGENIQHHHWSRMGRWSGDQIFFVAVILVFSF